MSKLLFEKKQVVVPGDIIAEGMDYLPGKGAFREGDKVRLPNGKIDTVGSIDIQTQEVSYSVTAVVDTNNITINRGANVSRFEAGDDIIINGSTIVNSTVVGTPNRTVASVPAQPFSGVIATHTSHTSSSGTASDSNSSVYAWKPFDASTHGDAYLDYYVVASAGSPWLQYQFTSAKRITNYQKGGRVFEGNPGVFVTGWILRGSTNGSSWTPIHSVSGAQYNNGAMINYTVSSPGNYTYYRFTDLVVGSPGYNVCLPYIQMSANLPGSVTYLSTITTADALPASPSIVKAIVPVPSGGQDVIVENGPADTGTVTLLSSDYDTLQLTQEPGEQPFIEMDLEVQYDRNKFLVTDDGTTVTINHGSSPLYPFDDGDKVVISGDSDVLTTIDGEPVRDSIIATMSSTELIDHPDTGTVTASSSQSGSAPHSALDGINNGTPNTTWGSGSSLLPQWWKYEFNVPTTVTEYIMEPRTANEGPTHWLFEGSNTGVDGEWDILHTVENFTGWPANWTGTYPPPFVLDTVGSYIYYRFYITGSSPPRIAIIQMAGSQEITQYTSTITPTDSLPTNPQTVELVPLTLTVDLHDSDPTHQILTETLDPSTTTNTAVVKTTLTDDSGSISDIKLRAHNTDFNEANATRLQADFKV